MQKAITVRGLTKCYGSKVAVDHLDLAVDRGEIFGLLGHNGAGKSTTIECILGVNGADVGSVEVLGMNPTMQRKELFQKVSVQFQRSNYQDKITVREICEVTHALYREPADWQGLLKTFGLDGMKKRQVAELSGGERQRLSLLLALIPNSDLVFLDELTTGLDSKARRDVWKHLERLKVNGLTVFLTSHYMDEVEALCDRVCILKTGKIVAIGSVAELIAKSPYDNLEQAYLWYAGEEDTNDEIV